MQYDQPRIDRGGRGINRRYFTNAIGTLDLATAIGPQRQRPDIAPDQQARQRTTTIESQRHGQLHCPLPHTRRKASVPLVPPKPKLFFRAMPMLRSRAAFAQ